MIDRAEAAFRPVADAVRDRRIPAAAFGVVAAGGARTTRFAGRLSNAADAPATDAASWFDLASLTKPLVTARAILTHAAAGELDLDAPLSALLPDLRQYDVAGAWERRLSPRRLLGHDTPLPAVVPLYTLGADARTLRAWVMQHEWPARETPVYSDINYMLLGIVLERLRGHAFAELPTPPGLALGTPGGACAATEFCHWRGRLLRGEVHDENAAALGGAAGHAGLFGTLDGVLDAAAALLDGSFAPPAAIAAMRTVHRPGRTLGWEAPTPGWSGGDTCSSATIGHLGFTGTGLWVDFGRGLAWALLTNRVHPSRHRDTGIATLRRTVGTQICAPTL